MVKVSGAVIEYGHDIGITVLVIIVERIEENTKTVPLVRRPEYVSVVVALFCCEPNGLNVYSENSKQFTRSVSDMSLRM